MGLVSGYVCDKCGKSKMYQKKVSEWLPNKSALIRFARGDRWSIGKETVLCPVCRKENGK